MNNTYFGYSDGELLETAKLEGLHNKELNEEWHRRYGINFPYRLNKHNQLLNCLSLKLVRKWECDKLIYEQAVEVKRRREKK